MNFISRCTKLYILFSRKHKYSQTFYTDIQYNDKTRYNDNLYGTNT